MTIEILLNIDFFLIGILLGALGMYLLDPERGQRRRTMLRARFFSQRDRLSARLENKYHIRLHGRHGLASKVLRRHNEQ